MTAPVDKPATEAPPRSGVQDPHAPDADRRSLQLERTGTLAQEYARLALEDVAPRRVDIALRGLDLLIASAMLLLTLPLIVLLALVIRVTSHGAAFYRGPRVGRGGQVFRMVKFRTLTHDAESRLGPFLGPELTERTTHEMTPVGKVLRGTQLDELPQLWNVLWGDMSIVGPRPIRPAFFEELSEDIPQYWQRLVVRPGITGLAQLRMTREMSWADKLAHDMEYVADRSVGLYMRILIDTAARAAKRIARVTTGREVEGV